jgi:hypothetical protein
LGRPKDLSQRAQRKTQDKIAALRAGGHCGKLRRGKQRPYELFLRPNFFFRAECFFAADFLFDFFIALADFLAALAFFATLRVFP